jgi:hypothetical protein
LGRQLRQAPRFGLEAAKLIFKLAGGFTGRGFGGCGPGPFGFSSFHGGAGQAEGFKRGVELGFGGLGLWCGVGAKIGAVGFGGLERAVGAGKTGAGLLGPSGRSAARGLLASGAGGKLFDLGFSRRAGPLSGISSGLKLRHTLGRSGDARGKVAAFQLNLAERCLSVVDNLDLTVTIFVETAKIVTEASHGLSRLGRVALSPILFDGEAVQDRCCDLFFFAQGANGLFRRQGLSSSH